MSMTPAEYVAEIVVPTVREFRESRRSRQRAYLACIATFHIKDHLKKAGATRIEQTMRTACFDEFELVRSVCNGSKHLEVDASHAIPFVAGLDYDRPPSRAGLGRAGRSIAGDLKGGRVVSHNSKKYNVYTSVRSVLLQFQLQYPSLLAACDLTGC